MTPRRTDPENPMTMTPYYQDDAVTIYHGDLRDGIAGASPVPQPDPPSECVSVEHCRVDSLCGGSPEHCRIHDPCTCMSDAPDPECIIHGTSSHRTPLRAALAASPEPPEVNEHG